MTSHLRPTAPVAADALLPGDPGRALALAQDLLAAPLMANHHRGLWGYHGETPDGSELTVQATGVGGPSAAIVLSELAELGVRRAIRVGTCRAIRDGLEPGALVVATEAVAADGTSRSLGARGAVGAASLLTEALRSLASEAVAARVTTRDLYYYDSDAENGSEADGSAAVEMCAAPLFALGQALEVEVGCLLVVIEQAGEGAAPGALAEGRLAEAELRMGRIAAAALGIRAERPA